MSLSRWCKLKTYMRLGLSSVASVAMYRVACGFGYYRKLLPVKKCPDSDSVFFNIPSVPVAVPGNNSDQIVGQAEKLIAGYYTFFFMHETRLGNPPDWFLDPFSGAQISHDTHWSKVDEFAAGDIKIVWEASRFDWILVFAQAYLVSQNERYISVLNNWLNDWLRHNPINMGPNWKCGQEASFRVLNLAMTALLLGQTTKPSNALLSLIRVHLVRIVPSLNYAMAQDNNHGTSEAAALFIGGNWLEQCAPGADSRKWQKQGRYWLENRVNRLIGRDGSFSQYSVNYHRVVIDTLSIVELWRKRLTLPSFSHAFQARCRVAVQWLHAFVAPDTGDAPNIGANDGARMFPLGISDYRDYRPSVQLASLLFYDKRAYTEGPWNVLGDLFGVSTDTENILAKPESKVFLDGGYVLLRHSESFGVVRFANFRFRPSHADCLHFDLWHRGINIIKDGGTYSYNAEAGLIDYFSGTASHNTVQFDDRNQMPRISRFLFGDWLRMSEMSDVQNEGERQIWTGAYTDGEGASHKRTIEADGSRWLVKDEISGFRDKAVLRWRLAPGEWVFDGDSCRGELAELSVECSAPVKRMEMVTGWESRYYLEKTELPVLEVEVESGPAVFTTEITLK